METKINTLKNQALFEIEHATSHDALKAIEVKILGKKGVLTDILKGLKDVAPGERPKMGSLANLVKNEILAAIEKQKEHLSENYYTSLEQTQWIDHTLPGKMHNTMGTLHPISTIQLKIEEIFKSMGFYILDGPDVETEYNNFTALNIPEHHPARDMQDTFWTTGSHVLRTHTSPVQIRGMKKLKPPFRAIAPGRVFRHEATDAAHDNTFYQIEGLMVDRNVSLSHLIFSMKTLIDQIMEQDSEVRLRPGYFPFVEPGFELDMKCKICGGNGCSVCKHVGWIEVLPCGLVHPNVLRAGGIDPSEFSGYAFGLGLDRLVMMKYGIHDIRYFHSGDLNFLKQFV